MLSYALYAFAMLLYALIHKLSPKINNKTAGHVFTGFTLRKPVKTAKTFHNTLHITLQTQHTRVFQIGFR